MDTKEYMQHQAESLTDGITIQHADGCGQCHKQRIMGKTARRMLRWNVLNIELPLKALMDMVNKTWRRSKYYRLYTTEQQAGRDPIKAFESKGWEP